MAKKKRSKKNKNKQNNQKTQQKSSRKKEAKESKPKRLTLGKVLPRFVIFLLVAAGIFYITLNFAVGGNALWKISVLTILPFGNLAVRKQFFETQGYFSLLKPTVSQLTWTIGGFVVANGLSLLLFRFIIMGRPAEDLLARIASGILFVVSPVFAFTLKLKVTTWAAFTSQTGTVQASLLLASVLYYYGCVALLKLETEHDLAEQKPLHMLPV